MITMAPERPGALTTITQLSNKGIVMSIGHMAATYPEAAAGIKAGAKMITHLYNQMNPHHHREPGPLGIISGATDIKPDNETKILQGPEEGDSISHRPARPYFGIIADGHHVHPASIRLAHLTHPEGLVLVTDALMLLGGEDGTVDWLTRRLTKKGIKVMLEGTDIIAGR
jgi:N-acetylglucosamine-6-phosphate deacetylase